MYKPMPTHLHVRVLVHTHACLHAHIHTQAHILLRHFVLGWLMLYTRNKRNHMHTHKRMHIDTRLTQAPCTTIKNDKKWIMHLYTRKKQKEHTHLTQAPCATIDNAPTHAHAHTNTHTHELTHIYTHSHLAQALRATMDNARALVQCLPADTPAVLATLPKGV